MLWYAPFQIRGRTNVFFFWKTNAADDVDVPHRSSRTCGEFNTDEDVTSLRHGANNGRNLRRRQPVFARWASPGTTLRPLVLTWLRHAKPERLA
jgi:hypothetical protein